MGWCSITIKFKNLWFTLLVVFLISCMQGKCLFKHKKNWKHWFKMLKVNPVSKRELKKKKDSCRLSILSFYLHSDSESAACLMSYMCISWITHSFILTLKDMISRIYRSGQDQRWVILSDLKWLEKQVRWNCLWRRNLQSLVPWD